MEKLVETLQRFAWLLLLSSLFVIAGLVYTYFKAEEKAAVMAQSDLTVSVGDVLKGAEITVENRGRRGRNTTERFFELTVRPDVGAEQKWRVDEQVPRAKLEKLIGRRAQAKIDPTDSNLVYVLASEGEFLLTYAQMLDILEGYAQTQQAKAFDPYIWAFAGVLLLLGVSGVWLRRRLEPEDSGDFKNTHIH